jgi:hypothetical protein
LCKRALVQPGLDQLNPAFDGLYVHPDVNLLHVCVLQGAL